MPLTLQDDLPFVRVRLAYRGKTVNGALSNYRNTVTAYPPRLIEVNLPIKRIFVHTGREKLIRREFGITLLTNRGVPL
jgi:hypothetical protein